jgi:hypothetical protein
MVMYPATFLVGSDTRDIRGMPNGLPICTVHSNGLISLSLLKKWYDSCWRAKDREASQRTVALTDPKPQTPSSGFKPRTERCKHATLIVLQTG